MTPRAHVIRLAGVWEIGRVAPAARPIAWTRVRLDRLTDAGLPFAPDVYRRGFGSPTGIADGQAVWLELTDLRLAAEIRLNSVVLADLTGPVELVRLRIETLLADRNELLVVRASASAPAEKDATALPWPFDECRLVIEE